LLFAWTLYPFCKVSNGTTFQTNQPTKAKGKTSSLFRNFLNVLQSISKFGSMKIVHARFDEILHVHRIEANRALPRRTVFSFKMEYRYTPYITISGFPRLENGMSVVAVLRDENDWKTLVGWRDSETREIAAPDPSWHLKRLLFFLAWGVIATVLAWPKHPSGAGSWAMAIGFAALASLFSALEYRGWRRVQKDVAELNELLSNAPES
jgi:hypothetical protein